MIGIQHKNHMTSECDMKKLLVFGVIVLFLGLAIAPSTGFSLEKQSTIATNDGNTLYVGGSGPGNYTKIQDAINDSSDGDTVYVYNDSSPYYENLEVDKSISLIGENRNTTVIDGSGIGDVVNASSDFVYIGNFTIQNGESSWDFAGININSCYHIQGNGG